MNCFVCNGEIIHGGDHSYEDYGADGDGIVSNLHCMECGRYYLMYSPEDGDDSSVHHHDLS